MFLHTLASNAYQLMKAYVSAAKKYFVKFNLSYLTAKINLKIPAGPYQGALLAFKAIEDIFPRRPPSKGSQIVET